MLTRFALRLFPLVALLLAAVVRAGDAGIVRLLDMESEIVAGWEPEQPTSAMRLLQYRVPGAGAGDDAAFIVYYFGSGQGGSNEANIQRWQSQFTGPEGGPVQPVITTSTVGTLPVTLVELRGSYARSIGMGQQVEAQPDQTLLAAIVETPKGNLFAQLHGPTTTVGPARAGFEAFLAGLRRAAQP